MASPPGRPTHWRSDSVQSAQISTSPTEVKAHSPTARLRKPIPSQPHSRTASGQFTTPHDPTQPSLEVLKLDVAHNAAMGTSIPLAPPPIVGGSYSRSSSADRSSRPGTPGSMSYSRPTTPQPPTGNSPPSSAASPADPEQKKKRTWFGKSKKDKTEESGPTAWIAGHPQKMPYDSDGLLAARPMHELCDNYNGNCFVYLWPRVANKGASFRIDSRVLAASPTLTRMAYGDVQNPSLRQAPLDARTQGLSLNESPRPMQEVNLYLPIKFPSESTSPKSKTPQSPTQTAMDDLQALVDVRNFFAFLCGQSLVATGMKSSFFSIFMTIGNMLKTNDFTNLDGSTYGDIATRSFDAYVGELGLADCRSSRDKTIEGLVLGERMKSVLLYNEAFAHAAGKHADIVAARSPKFALISPITQNRLIRASMDLDKRIQSIRLILNDFDFPMIKNSTIMNSKVSEERKEGVRFDQWKDAFMAMRKYTMGLYQSRYGNWPPKARSKKNDLETSGLNRKVCRDAYQDMTSMYDLFVDRKNLTTRTANGPDATSTRDSPATRAMRTVLNEYDGSSPPVKPPIPFDMPILPTLRTTRPDFGKGDTKADTKASSKKLKDDEIARILRASWNDDVVVSPFIDALREMEKRAAHGCTINELVELRMGHWLFMYVVLQALPMLACDVAGVKHSKDVEYFLCQPSRGGVPWASSAGRFASGGVDSGIASLPGDAVEHGVEGIYRRSHCWVMAEKWSASDPVLNMALHQQEAITHAQLAAEDDFNDGGYRSSSSIPRESRLSAPRSRDVSPAGYSRNSYMSDQRNSYLGLEVPGEGGLSSSVGSAHSARWSSASGEMQIQMPMQTQMQMPRQRPRTPVHVVDTSKTFDSILSDVPGQKKGKKK